MNRSEDNELERQLRTAFEPEAEAVDRVVAAALRHRHRRPSVLRVVAATALVAVLVAVLLVMRPRSEVQADSLRLEYMGSVALFKLPDGSCWLVTPDAAIHGSQTPLNIIVVEGEEP